MRVTYRDRFLLCGQVPVVGRSDIYKGPWSHSVGLPCQPSSPLPHQQAPQRRPLPPGRHGPPTLPPLSVTPTHSPGLNWAPTPPADRPLVGGTLPRCSPPERLGRRWERSHLPLLLPSPTTATDPRDPGSRGASGSFCSPSCGEGGDWLPGKV